ncbi:Protein N-acetyltransferase, RimJ/RimL family [Geodermatophilus africanus]|uniref:Protein N-acetyltransferase, RimJ/RimL family n=1 Tax=Geodermatophilus africanus TaxID=1137993 RepID=A0A1H3KVQ5_9ACTN|nr:GNAT family N-acetyltransferase [Geodermatophilus africanus]SDY55818.1 Protein N-acetyltransferase, RimJ/RimL family [Geodermatophilus africanus]
MDPVELAAGALLLRPWREDDADDVVAAMQDPVMRRWNGLPATTRPDALAFLRRRGDWSTGDHASWAVTDAATGGLLGSVTLHSLDREQGNAQVGYWTVPPARGRAVAVRAVDVACRWAFAAVPLDRVELCHAVENTASGRVAEKAGFTLEGRLRRSYRYGDGARHDELIWSRLADDPAPDLSSRRR